MAIQLAVPYLNCGGRAAEAIALYEEALGAQVQELKRFGDVRPNCPASLEKAVAHAVLRLGEAMLYLSDGDPDKPPTSGGPISVALTFDDEAQARRSFDKLAAGGTIATPIINAPWGGIYGALHDRFGIHWMFTTSN